MENEVKLKPCAHCGGEAKLYSTIVECRKCGIQTSVRASEAFAIAAWNSRAVPSVDMAEVERLVGEFERSISEPCNDPKQAASEYLTARRALLDHGNGRTPAKLELAGYITSIPAENKMAALFWAPDECGYAEQGAGDADGRVIAVYADKDALAAVKTKGGESK